MSDRTLTTEVRSGIRVEWLTIAWMTLEAVVSVGAGLATGSIALIAFGADSVIELISAGALLWRLALEGSGFGAPAPRVARAERQASRVVGWSLLALAAYVVTQAAHDLWTHASPESSPIGIALAASALLVMPGIVWMKLKVAASINSRALKGDAACGVVCIWMAVILLIGLASRAAFGWWWADPVAALGLVYFIAKEGREALSSECCACGH